MTTRERERLEVLAHELRDEAAGAHDVAEGLRGAGLELQRATYLSALMTLEDVADRLTSLLSEMGDGTEEPEWIVNDLAELGVKINGRCFFLYKGGNIEYDDPRHEDENGEMGAPMLYRRVGKREFGEVCHPFRYWDHGHNTEERYTEPVVDPFNDEDKYDVPPEYRWQPLPEGPKR